MSSNPPYLAGTATGGLLSNLSAQQQGQQASTAYTPGQGQAPLAAGQTTAGSYSAANGATQGALSGYQATEAAVNSGAITNSFLQNMQSQTAANAGVSPVSSGATGAVSGATSGAGGENSGGPTIAGAPTQSAYYNPEGGLGNTGGVNGGGSSGGSSGGFTSGASPTGTNAATPLTPQQIAQAGANTLQPQSGPAGPPPNVLGANASQTNTAAAPYAVSTAPASPADTSGASLQMQAANPQTSLSQYDNSLANQVLNTPGAYQQSPGYQFAVNQAMQADNQQGSTQGLLGSGSLAKAETTQASGMAMQDYNNWWNQQSGLVSNYQNQLAGLAGGATGAATANTTAQNLAANTTTTGQNVSGLLANQGNTDASGMINTGSAEAGDIMNAGNSQAQVNSTNSATQIGAATSGLF